MFPTNARKTDSKTVIESARQAREERALQKRKEYVVLRLQTLARGYLTRRKLTAKWLEELDDIIGYKDKQTIINSQKTASTAQQRASTKTANSSSTELKFQSFSSNTLTGTYRNITLLSTKPKDPDTPQPNKELSPDTVRAKIAKNATASLEENAKPKYLTGTEIYSATKKFLRLFSSERDKWRFEHLCKIVLENSNSDKNIKSSYCYLCISKDLALPWIQQVKKLLQICLQYTQSLNPQEHHSSRMINVCLNMLVTFTDASKWKLVKKQPALQIILTQISNSVSHDLLSHQNSLQVLGSLLSRSLESSNASCNDAMIFGAFTMTLRPIISGGMKDEDVISFVKHILSVPGLLWTINKITPQGISLCQQHHFLLNILNLLHGEGQCQTRGLTKSNVASSSNVIDILSVTGNLVHLSVIDKEILEQNYMKFVLTMNQLLDYIIQSTTQQKSSTSTWHPVLGYFKSNEKSNKNSMKYVKLQLEFFWNPVLLRAVFCDVLALQSLHSDDVTPVQAEQIATKSAPKTKLTDRVASYLKKLSLSKSREAFKPTGGRKLEYKEVKNTTMTCLMFKKCLSIVTKQLQLEMLTGLTFMDEVLCRLWRFICELGTSGGLKLFLSALTLPPHAAEPYFAVFTLFCDMTSHILSILDDVEFYEEQIPFHLEELVTISDFLRTFVFRIIWDQLLNETSIYISSVFESAHTLLIMLHDRDARRPFTPIDHWICRQVKSSTIRSEVEKMTSRGNFLIEKTPFVIPHKDRVLLFRSVVSNEKSLLEDECPVHIKVRRSRLLEDGFEQLTAIPNKLLKGTIRVKFINDLGLDEAGIDQDGVFKEFLEEIIKKVFNPDMNLFRVTTAEDGKLYPSPTSYLQDDHLKLFFFVGEMLGKAVYEGIVVDVPFATFFLRNLQQQHSMLYSPLDELPSLDLEFYKNLTWIKRYEGDISDLDLTFTYEEDILGRVETRELEPGGAAIPVTNQNRITYIHKLAHYRLHTQVKDQTKAFTAGFRSIVNKQWTAMFSAPELQRLISGDNVDLDLTDLKHNITYYGGFHASHRVIKWLWDILEKDYTSQQRSAFLKFVTSCSRPPLLGFIHLQPQFSIRCVEVGDDDDNGDTVGTVLRGFFRISSAKKQGIQKHRLPTASTCFNLLKLPNYPSKDILREKLNQALLNNTGFELS